MRTQLLVLVALSGCGPAVEGDDAAAPLAAPMELQLPSPATRVTFHLDTRSGTAAEGWSFGKAQLVPSDEADVTLQISDCGARGRWANLVGNGVQFCAKGPAWNADRVSTNPEGCQWLQDLDAGGTRPSTALGDGFLVRRGQELIARLVLVDRSTLAPDWYAQPIAPWSVTFEIAP